MLTAIIILSVITAVALARASYWKSAARRINEIWKKVLSENGIMMMQLAELEDAAESETRRTLARHEAQSASSRKGWETRKARLKGTL